MSLPFSPQEFDTFVSRLSQPTSSGSSIFFPETELLLQQHGFLSTPDTTTLLPDEENVCLSELPHQQIQTYVSECLESYVQKCTRRARSHETSIVNAIVTENPDVPLYSELTNRFRVDSLFFTSCTNSAYEYYFKHVLSETKCVNGPKLQNMIDPMVRRKLLEKGTTEPQSELVFEVHFFHPHMINTVTSKVFVPFDCQLLPFVQQALVCKSTAVPQTQCVQRRFAIHIENVIYSYPDALEDASNDVAMCWSREEGMTHKSVKSISQVRFRDIPSIRLWARYTIRHIGSCNHDFVIVDVHRISPPSSSVTEIAKYQFGIRLCSACRFVVATIATYYDAQTPNTPTLLCDNCCKLFYFNEEGRNVRCIHMHNDDGGGLGGGQETEIVAFKLKDGNFFDYEPHRGTVSAMSLTT